MKELMLELLTYEPYGKFLPEEKMYICEILSGNDNPPPSLAKFHKLFLDFHYCVQRGAFDDVDWLRQWKTAYGHDRLPLFFKKICFYLMVKGEFSGSEFMEKIGLQVSRLKRWGISPQFRKYAEADTYSAIRAFRNGVKKPYIVSIVKRLYFEAGRQLYFEAELKKSETMTLRKLPQFVDVFAGTASVAASVRSEGCPPPVINDYDPVMVCFAWVFTHYPHELRKRIARLHNELMTKKLNPKELSYDAQAYKKHHDPNNTVVTPEALDDPETQRKFKEALGYSDNDIKEKRERAQRHQEFIIRTRSCYLKIKLVMDIGDKRALRKGLRNGKIDFNSLPTNYPKKVEDVLDYAEAAFYYYSFSPPGKKGIDYDVTSVSAKNYRSYLRKLVGNSARLHDSLKALYRTDIAHIACKLLELQLEPSDLHFESIGHFSRYLQKAEFYCEDFRTILQRDTSNRIYYLDSPYFLTVGYDVGFSDDDHKDMLDILRNAKFKWIFSMQYNPSNERDSSEDEAKCNKQEHIIKDYKTYYRGFYAELRLDSDQTTYVSDAPAEDAEGLYAILFDIDKVKQKWKNMKPPMKEMLVVNFNPLRTIPLHDSAVVYPFDLFLKCADEKKDYQDIVKRAVAWRKSNIESKYTNEVPV